jgi:hypothetical protein
MLTLAPESLLTIAGIRNWIDLQNKDGTIQSLYDHWIMGHDARPKTSGGRLYVTSRTGLTDLKRGSFISRQEMQRSARRATRPYGKMTRVKHLAVCLFTSLLAGYLVSAASAQSPLHSLRYDNQVWTDVQLSVPLNKTVDFVLLGTLRFGRDVTHPVDERLGGGFSFKVGKYLTLTPAYLHIQTQPFRGLSFYENRLAFAATPRFQLGRFTLTDRNQFERRLRHPQGDSSRYRNFLLIEHPIKIGKLKLNGLVGDEVFYDWSFNAWVRNRFYIGIGKTFNKHFTQDVYYMKQNDGHNLPGNLNVVGTRLRFHL